MTVKLKKLTLSDIEAFHSENRYKKMVRRGDTTTPDAKSNVFADDVIDLCSDDDDDAVGYDDADPLHHDVIGNVSQTATTPASKLMPFIEPMQTQRAFEMYTETSTTQAMFNVDDEKYAYQNQENHQSFLNGAQIDSSIVRQIDKLTELKDISMQTMSAGNQAHISIDLTL